MGKSGRKSQQIFNYTFNFIPGNSFFHSLNAVSKIIWFSLISLVVLLQNSLIILTGFYLATLAVVFLSKIRLIGILRRLRWIIFFVIVTIVINVFFNAIPMENQQILFYIIYPYVPVRRLAVYIALRVGLWVMTLSTTGVIFLNTTSPNDLVYGLRKLGISYKLAFALMVGLRYIPIIQDNTNAVILAQKARGLDMINATTFQRKLELIKDRLVTSLILIFKNASSTSIAMELRGFGKFKDRTDIYQSNLKARDYLFLLILGLFTVFIIMYRFNLIPGIPPMPSIYDMFW
jgi:energy-coupling factor transport system permease protein